jgi:hypothetical protein
VPTKSAARTPRAHSSTNRSQRGPVPRELRMPKSERAGSELDDKKPSPWNRFESFGYARTDFSLLSILSSSTTIAIESMCLPTRNAFLPSSSGILKKA